MPEVGSLDSEDLRPLLGAPPVERGKAFVLVKLMDAFA